MCKLDENCDPDKEYSLEEVAKHNKEDDCWIVLGEIERGTSMIITFTFSICVNVDANKRLSFFLKSIEVLHHV